MKSISEKIKIIDDIETKKEVRKGWDNAFKQAIANGDTPENDMFEGMKNAFDDSEW
jgi:DNA-binding ferritin-like protein